jgi:hypothetical protein
MSRIFVFNGRSTCVRFDWLHEINLIGLWLRFDLVRDLARFCHGGRFCVQIDLVREVRQELSEIECDLI